MPEITPAILAAADNVDRDLDALDMSTRTLLTLLRAGQDTGGGGGGSLSTDFSETADGDPIAGFTNVAGSSYTAGNAAFLGADDAGAIGGRVVVGQRSADGYQGVLMDAAGTFDPADSFEILALMELSFIGTFAGGLALLMSGGGASGDGYFVLFNSGTSVRVRKAQGGGFSTIATETFSASANTPYWVRARKDGAQIRVRVWADGGSEPGTWLVDVTDGTPVTVDGGVGIGLFSRFTQITVDYLSVALGAGSAPSPA